MWPQLCLRKDDLSLTPDSPYSYPSTTFEQEGRALVTDLDAVIIGGGHNGLVAACYLAKAGLKVTVLERREVVGGASVTEDTFPGFRVSTAA